MMLRKWAGSHWAPRPTWLVIVVRGNPTPEFDLFTKRGLAEMDVPLNYRVIK